MSGGNQAQDTRSAHDHSRVVPLLVLAGLGLGCILALWRVAVAVPLKVPLDPNEGWNGYHTLAAMTGGNPYPDPAGYMTNNYPPLSFYVVGTLGQVLGDNIVAGRIVSLVSFLFLTSAIALLARRFGCALSQAVFAALFFAGTLLLFSDYVGMDDPQLLGHALQISALLLLFARGSAAIDICAAALLVAGIFVKHNLVAMPLAVVLWLWFDNRRAAVRVAGATLLLGLAGLAVFREVLGFGLLSRLVSARLVSPAFFFANFHLWLVHGALPLAATLYAATARSRQALFIAIYALTATVIGAAFLGGAGVDANAMFDADIAISLGAALALERIRTIGPLPTSILPLVLALPLAVSVATRDDIDWQDANYWLHPLAGDEKTAAADIAFVRARPGPAMCEMLSLCYWAGKPAAVDVFNTDQQFRTGARSEQPFIRLVDEKNFAVVQLDSVLPFPFPPDVQREFARNYRVDRTSDDGVFLVPR